MCPACRRPLAGCVCERSAAAPAGDGVARITRETQGRKGRVVTVVRGLALDAAALAGLGSRLKAACGSGGSVKDGVIEIQGDHREQVAAILLDSGFGVRRSG